MDGRNPQRIQKHLEDETVQQRVRQNILRGREDLTVTIGRASELSGFSISQLRDWEKKGLLKPVRPELSDAKSATGQRQYPISELDKLAIIRELIDEGFPPGAIPPNIEEIWTSLQGSQSPTNINVSMPESRTSSEAGSNKYLPINKRMNMAYLDHFYWRFYASRALQLVLTLLAEDVLGTYSGLILPAKESYDRHIPDSSNLAEVGESLVGWLGQTRSFCTLLSPAPSFEYPSDFQILPLLAEGEQEAEDPTLVVVQRDEVSKLNLTRDVVETARCLLKPLYEDKWKWKKYFGEGMQDLINPGVDFTPRLPDRVLTHLTNIVVRLGGKNSDGEDRWRFCYILLPENQTLPLQQRSLVIRAMSRHVRHSVGMTTLTPEKYRTSLSVRAFQSGHIVYRQESSPEDTTLQFSEIEGPVRSNIAVPIGGETGEPLGVLYVTSYETNAFSPKDCRVLRIMTRMIEELLNGYNARKQLTRNLVDLIKDPETVDPSFREFWSENDFIRDIEGLLKDVQVRESYEAHGKVATTISADVSSLLIPDEISFIAVDIDHQDRIVRDYNEQMLRNLQKTIGQRIRDLLPALFTRYTDYKLYHIYGGRFYLFLRGFSLEKTKKNADRLKKALEGNVAFKQSDLLGSTYIIPDVSLHLAVTWYSYDKLKEFLETKQYQTIADVSSILYRTLDSVLKLGIDEGGNVIYGWDPETATFAAYRSDESRK